MVSLNQIRQYLGMIETNWLWWHSFLVLRKRKETFAFLLHWTPSRNQTWQRSLQFSSNSKQTKPCAWLSELKSSNQICKINISLLPASTKTKTNRILVRKCWHQVLKPASTQYVQQCSDLIKSLQCDLLQLH